MIKFIAEKLNNGQKSVIKIMFRNNQTRIVGFGLQKEMKLIDHQLPVCTQIIMIRGELEIDSKIEVVRLKELDTYTIPKKVIHQVKAFEETIALLILDFKE